MVENAERFISLTSTAWTAIASIVSAASLLVLGVFNFLYLRAAQTQALAANTQAQAANSAVAQAQASNQIAQQALQQQQRPWVGLDDSATAISTSAIAIGKDGAANIQFSIRFKNFGGAPAQGILATAQLMITEDISAEQQNLFRPNQDESIGQVLFLGSIGAITSASVFPSAKMKSMAYDHLFEAWLVGSIRYRDRFGNHYHTGFRYWMVERQNMARPFRFTPLPGTQIEMMPFVPNGAGGSIT